MPHEHGIHASIVKHLLQGHSLCLPVTLVRAISVVPVFDVEKEKWGVRKVYEKRFTRWKRRKKKTSR